jgi:hypothetical protein
MELLPVSEPVTKEQYEFYRSLYDEEEQTSVQLEGRSKVYLGVVSAILAAILFKADDARKTADALHIPWELLLLEALAMTLALLVVLWALRFRDYQAVSDGLELLEKDYDDWPTNEQFYEGRLADYAEASTENRRINMETARLLAVASWLMASGILMLLATVALAVWRNR